MSISPSLRSARRRWWALFWPLLVFNPVTVWLVWAPVERLRLRQTEAEVGPCPDLIDPRRTLLAWEPLLAPFFRTAPGSMTSGTYVRDGKTESFSQFWIEPQSGLQAFVPSWGSNPTTDAGQRQRDRDWAVAHAEDLHRLREAPVVLMSVTAAPLTDVEKARMRWLASASTHFLPWTAIDPHAPATRRAVRAHIRVLADPWREQRGFPDHDVVTSWDWIPPSWWMWPGQDDDPTDVEAQFQSEVQVAMDRLAWLRWQLDGHAEANWEWIHQDDAFADEHPVGALRLLLHRIGLGQPWADHDRARALQIWRACRDRALSLAALPLTPESEAVMKPPKDPAADPAMVWAEGFTGGWEDGVLARASSPASALMVSGGRSCLDRLGWSLRYRQVRLLVAAMRRFAVETGRRPTTLEELIPHHLPTVPPGWSLRYRPPEERLLDHSNGMKIEDGQPGGRVTYWSERDDLHLRYRSETVDWGDFDLPRRLWGIAILQAGSATSSEGP